MTTQQIRFFLEAAKCLNFTEAAKRLFVSQPTLSKQIALLEEELGLRLFYRDNRMVGLTPTGAILRVEMEKVESYLVDMIDRARNMEQGMEGHLSIGLLDVINPSHFVTPLLTQFQIQYPKVDLEVSFRGFSRLREELEKGLLDVVFSKDFDLNSMRGLNGFDVYQNTPAVLMPRNHPMASAPFLKVSQLKQEKFIVLSADQCRASTHTLVDLCGKEGFYPKIVKYADSNIDRIFYVSLGYGVAILDKEIPIPDWADLLTVPLQSNAADVFAGIDLRMVWMNNCSNPSVRLLIALAKDMLTRQEAQ